MAREAEPESSGLLQAEGLLQSFALIPDCIQKGPKSERMSSGLTLPAETFTMPLEELRPLLWMLWEESNQASRPSPRGHCWPISGERSSEGAQEDTQDRVLKRLFSNKTIYVLAWTAARPHIQGEISNHFEMILDSGQALKSQHQW